MEAMRDYLLRVILTALVCAVFQCFPGQGQNRGLLRFLCGVILTITVAAPLGKMKLRLDPDRLRDLEVISSEAAGEGEQMSRDMLAGIIKTEAEAYILDKARELAVRIQVEIGLSDDTMPVPVSAVIYGTLPEQARQALQETLSSQLGITEENQTWIG